MAISVPWSYFNSTAYLDDKYLPPRGEGTSRATQVVTAVCKLVYKYYNDGDIYDNTSGFVRGYCNDITSYANWLYWHTDRETAEILRQVKTCRNEGEYTFILKALVDHLYDERLLAKWDKEPLWDSVYDDSLSTPFEVLDGDDDCYYDGYDYDEGEDEDDFYDDDEGE